MVQEETRYCISNMSLSLSKPSRCMLLWCPSKNCENNVLKSPANVMQSSTPKAFANDLSHLSMGTSESSKIFIEAAEETIDQCKLVL
jgi:hypothetical protein